MRSTYLKYRRRILETRVDGLAVLSVLLIRAVVLDAGEAPEKVAARRAAGLAAIATDGLMLQEELGLALGVHELPIEDQRAAARRVAAASERVRPNLLL